MSNHTYRNPLALYALLLSLIPFLAALSMLGLQFGIGPVPLLYLIAQAGGVFLFFLIVVGSGLALAALARADGRRDLRIYAAFLLQLLSVGSVVIFELNR